MKLDKHQKEHLLGLISEGLETDKINARASNFEPPYTVTRQQVDFYRKSRGVKLKEIAEEGETSALKKGFALKEKRVEALSTLAEKMADDLLEGDRLWLDQVKALGSGEFMQIVDYEEFNGAEVAQFRATLDDIAKEVGDRKQKHEVTINPRKALAELLGVPEDALPADTSTDDVNA